MQAYQYKLIIDGVWSYSADHPTAKDGENINNVSKVCQRYFFTEALFSGLSKQQYQGGCMDWVRLAMLLGCAHPLHWQLQPVYRNCPNHRC